MSTVAGFVHSGLVTNEPAVRYTYAVLAARIEEVLGERPSKSALRSAAAEARRTGSAMARPRVTLGMPHPVPARSRTSPAEFDAAEVEEWLAAHPRLRWQRAVASITRSLAAGMPEEQVVAVALHDELPWRTITAELNAHDGRGRTVSGIHKRYRHLAPHPGEEQIGAGSGTPPPAG